METPQWLKLLLFRFYYVKAFCIQKINVGILGGHLVCGPGIFAVRKTFLKLYLVGWRSKKYDLLLTTEWLVSLTAMPKVLASFLDRGRYLTGIITINLTTYN